MGRTAAWVAAVAWAGFAALAWYTAQHPVNALDLRAYFALLGLGGRGTFEQLHTFRELLQPPVMLGLFALTASVTALVRRSVRPLVLLVLVGGVGSLLVVATKALVLRVNPTGGLTGLDGSFPSGHTFSAFTCTAGILVLLVRRMRWWHWLLAAVLGSSVGGAMVATGVHWLSDVVGGVLLGAGVLAVVTLLQPRSRRSPATAE